ncbi:MAG: hypothetical protein RI894_59, partial [Bacteroidota bacterium]
HLLLSWDDLDGDNKRYYYKIILCNADWTLSQLPEIEAIDGFSSDQVRDYKNSSRALMHYTHYSLSFPNDNIRLPKSGNYIIKIYTDDDEKNLVFTRRFMLVEPKMRVMAAQKVPAAGGRMRTFQELEFTVDYKGTSVRNPENEVKVAVLQNGRWDNAVTGVKPLFQKENQLIYNYQDVFTFPAGKEFRRLDLSSVRLLTEGVESLEQTDSSFEARTFLAAPLRNFAYEYLADANGKYVIKMFGSDAPEIDAEYVRVHFNLLLPFEVNGASVYVFGAMTNWKCAPQNKMHYNTLTHQYELILPLKQGFYGYQYAVVKDGDTQINTSHLEGDWYETENEYNILVYYRAFGERYDRLVCVQTINSTSK